MAHFILENFPQCIDDIYEGQQYRGENCLHIAIVNKDLSAVTFLLQRSRRLLLGKATGEFFKQGKKDR
jgi:hypothetical protein